MRNLLLLSLCALCAPVSAVNADEPRPRSWQHAWRVPCEGRTDTCAVVTGVATHGNLIACGGDDHCVRVFTRNGKLVHTLKGHVSWVKAVAFSPDGRYVVSAGDCRHIIVWDAQTGEEYHRFAARPGKIRSVAFCGNSRFAVGDTTNAIRLYSIPDRKQIRTFKGHTGTVSALSYNARYDVLVSGSYDTTIRVWFLGKTPLIRINRRAGPRLIDPLNQRPESDANDQ